VRVQDNGSVASVDPGDDAPPDDRGGHPRRVGFFGTKPDSILEASIAALTLSTFVGDRGGRQRIVGN
jgi:hypothetical protein